MKEIAFVVGIAAVVLLFLGYLQKTRRKIIWLNAMSRALFILQYVLLFAFEGAVLEIAGIIAVFLAQKKETPFIRKRVIMFYFISCVMVIGVGLLPYKNFISLFPIAGSLLQISALWLDDEKWIRRISLLGAPFWFAYNVVSGAYGACVGDIMTVVSIVAAMLKYDTAKKRVINGAETNHG